MSEEPPQPTILRFAAAVKPRFIILQDELELASALFPEKLLSHGENANKGACRRAEDAS